MVYYLYPYPSVDSCFFVSLRYIPSHPWFRSRSGVVPEVLQPLEYQLFIAKTVEIEGGFAVPITLGHDTITSNEWVNALLSAAGRR